MNTDRPVASVVAGTVTLNVSFTVRSLVSGVAMKPCEIPVPSSVEPTIVPALLMPCGVVLNAPGTASSSMGGAVRNCTPGSPGFRSSLPTNP